MHGEFCVTLEMGRMQASAAMAHLCSARGLSRVWAGGATGPFHHGGQRGKAEVAVAAPGREASPKPGPALRLRRKGPS